MAKSLRSKIERRLRRLKRNHLANIMHNPKINKLSQRLQATILGLEYRQAEVKNAFVHPEDADAVFPQFKPAPIIDLRSSAIPGSGREWKGGNRKSRTITQEFKSFDVEQIEVQDREEEKEGEEVEIMHEQKQNMGKSAAIKRKRNSKLRKTFVF